MPSFYCPHCKEPVEEDDARYDLYCDAVYYPSDCAHPAEYIGPLCPHCGTDLADYECDVCHKPGMPDDELLLLKDDEFICHDCRAKRIFMSGKSKDEIYQEIYNSLVSEYGFKEDGFTEGYVDILMEEYEATTRELERLKFLNCPAIPFSEIKKENPWIKSIEDRDAHRLNYHRIEFIQTFERGKKGRIYESKRPFDIVKIEIYDD